jgi:carboxypeptidase C (cathepsin A)
VLPTDCDSVDIRHPLDDPTPPTYFEDFLNLASTQEAIGTAINYTAYANGEIYFAFQQTGDFVYQSLLEDLEMLLNNSVRVSLIYGDADYICNWFGGEAVSMELSYTHSAEFRKTGYVPFMALGKEWGETRQYGNFSFTRIYEAGHEVPYYQPEAALAIFNRTIYGFDIATGEKKVTDSLSTNGEAKATHTEPYVALPSQTGSKR